MAARRMLSLVAVSLRLFRFRRMCIAGIAIVTMAFASGVATAGARVSNLYPADTTSTRGEPRIRLQVGTGPVWGEGDTGKGVAFVIEPVLSPAVGLMIRGEYVSKVSTASTSATAFALGVRLGQSRGAVRPYLELGAGLAVFDSGGHAGAGVPGFLTFDENPTSFLFDAGIGAAWRPVQSHLGIFVEARVLTYTGVFGLSSRSITPLHAGIHFAAF